MLYPSEPPSLANRFYGAYQREFVRAYADKLQDAALKSGNTVRQEPKTIEQGRHPHRNDRARAPSPEPSVETRGRWCECKARTEHLFKKSLHQSGQSSEPKRKDKHEMVSGLDKVLCA